MVITFNSRIVSLTDKCKPPSTKHAAVKRQGSFIAHVHHHHHGNHHHHHHHFHHDHGVTSTSNKRRRHKEEIEYAAASIQSALSNAGRWPVLVSRRERALPLGSVDRDGAKVVTSRVFDAQDGDGEEDDTKKKKKNSSGGTTTCTSNADDYNLVSMYVIADLIQSTQNYYCFSSDDDNTNNANTRTIQKANDDDATVADTSTSISNSNTSPPITTNQTIGDTNNINYDEKSSEDNSEGLSSWAPSSSSCRHFNFCDKKTIDNDNRSDEQSIDMAKEESSSSSLDSLASNDGDIECKSYNGPYSVIG